jgi:hypothetical protein
MLRLTSAMLRSAFEHPHAAAASAWQRREAVAPNVGAFERVPATAVALVDPALRHDLSRVEPLGWLIHFAVSLP